MKVYIIDLSFKQDSYFMFKRDIENLCEPLQINGFTPPYPELKKNDVLILTGSEYSIIDDYQWTENLLGYVRKSVNDNIPILAVCYGHQLIARSFCGKDSVGKAARVEMTFISIDIIKDHPLFEGLSNPFYVMSSHYDEVISLPEGFEVYAKSENCNIHTMIHAEIPVVSMQFHPEIDVDIARRMIIREKETLKKNDINYLELLNKIPDERMGAEKIFKNFFKLYT